MYTGEPQRRITSDSAWQPHVLPEGPRVGGSEGGGEPAGRSCQAVTGVWALKHLTRPCLSLPLVNFLSLALLNLRQAGIVSFQLSHLFPLVCNSDHTLNKKKVYCQKDNFFVFQRKQWRSFFLKHTMYGDENFGGSPQQERRSSLKRDPGKCIGNFQVMGVRTISFWPADHDPVNVDG